MSNENSRSRPGDRTRPGRNGRDGRDGTDGRKGEKGDRGQRGDDGKDGRDLALVPSIAQFDRDEDTHRTVRVRVVEIATATLLMTLTPAYDEDGFLESAQITPA